MSTQLACNVVVNSVIFLDMFSIFKQPTILTMDL